MILIQPAASLSAQSGGGRELVKLDFSKSPLGDPPKELRVTGGKLQVVEKDGTHMLKSATDSTFIVMIPEKVPNHFALEFDFLPKASGWTSGPAQLSFEGTREVSHSENSAHVVWNHNKVTVIGGGQAYAGGQIDLPEDLKEEVVGNLTKIRAEFNDSNLTVQTNGRTVFESKTAKFLRGRVVRVQLGGNDEDENAVYLAGMRVVALDGGSETTASTSSAETIGGLAPPRGTSGSSTQESAGSSNSTQAMTITGINATLVTGGVAVVKWDPVPVSATYVVLRWNVADPYCCNNMVSPDAPLTNTAWQDLGITKPGTYGYRVIGQTADGLVYGEGRFDFSGIGTQEPTGTAATTESPPLAPQSAPTVFAPSPTPEPVTTTADTTSTTATGLPRTGGTIVQPDATTETTSTTTTTATGTPTSGTIVQPDGTTAPYSSGPRRVSIMPTEPAPSTDTVYQMPAPSDLPTLDTTEPAPAPAPTEPVMAVMTEPSLQGATGMVIQARYRVLIAGLTVGTVSKDDILNLDGKGDEAFAGAAVVNWNRQTSQVTSYSFAQTRDYGDVGNGTIFGDRIKAGSASMTTGGLAGGDRVPGGFDPKGGALPAPASDQFPLLLWEGTLTAGAEAIVISPSVWEHDVSRAQFTLYKQNWSKASPAALMSSSVISDQLSSATISAPVAPISQLVVVAPPTPTFTGLPSDSYKMAIMIFPPGEDRPIGMRHAGPGVVTYQDRFVVITQEKVASMNAGDGTTFSLLYAEPNDALDPFLRGEYTLYLRVERTQ